MKSRVYGDVFRGKCRLYAQKATLRGSVPSFLTEDQRYLDKVGETGFRRIPPMRVRVPIQGTGAEHLVRNSLRKLIPL